jgi:predicted RNA binding protein YcfA (HicA-like mRNA interferase family)
LATLLQGYGYAITRQVGSHLQLECKRGGSEHHITIPAHASLRIGTLNKILRLVAGFLQIEKEQLVRQLFG